VEPAISRRDEFDNMLLLGQYKNKIMHYFFLEAVVCCALYAVGKKAGGDAAVPRAVLLSEAQFLYSLMHYEFHWKSNPDMPDSLALTLDLLVTRSILVVRAGDRVEVNPDGEGHFSFYCNLFWPFIDSYFISTVALFSLLPGRSATEGELALRVQTLATTLYQESMVCYYESCSKDTLGNAIYTLTRWGVLQAVVDAEDKKKRVVRSVMLSPRYQDAGVLTAFCERVGTFRKPAPVAKFKNGIPNTLAADLPILAKL
jgi:glycerol-3-phosphate O-acyltransferase